MTISKPDDTGALHLQGALEIYEAEALRAALLEHLAGAPGLALDLAAIESCDTAGAQLLVSARRAATVAGKPFACLRVPACVTEAWTLLGLPMDLISSQSN